MTATAMTPRATRTAITRDARGALHPVHCLLWANWHGATDLGRTRERLAADHPDLTFVAWVNEDLADLRGSFLSPNVCAVRVWRLTPQGYAEVMVTREEVLAA